MFELIGIKDIFDILIVAVIIYQIYRILVGTSAVNILVAVTAFAVLYVLVAYVFQMELLGFLMNKIVNVGVILVVILFQDDIRSFVTTLGEKSSTRIVRSIKRFFSGKVDSSVNMASIEQLVAAVEYMSKTKTGALIVIQRAADLSMYCETGELIDANVKARLIENIFYKNTPLHDGALIINNDTLKAAGCILPVSHDRTLPKNLGLRHRAALGLTEKTDAGVIVVSEETGKISFAERGRMDIGISPEKLAVYLGKGVVSEIKK